MAGCAMAGSVCPAIAIPCSLAMAFIENDWHRRASMILNPCFILLIGFTRMEETSAIATTLQLQDPSTDRSARKIARSNEPMSASDLAALPGS
jgi:hypothetical protein